MGYFQGINNSKLLNIINIANRFAAPIVTACVLGNYFGSNGIMTSVAVGKIILLVFILVLVWAKTKRFPSSLESFMFLPDNFGGAEIFCLSHCAKPKKAKLIICSQ